MTDTGLMMYPEQPGFKNTQTSFVAALDAASEAPKLRLLTLRAIKASENG